MIVKINRIVEPPSYIFDANGFLVGTCNNYLELNDVCIQIMKLGVEGYTLEYEGNLYPIEKNGRIYYKGKPEIYPTYGHQMEIIMGF